MRGTATEKLLRLNKGNNTGGAFRARAACILCFLHFLPVFARTASDELLKKSLKIAERGISAVRAYIGYGMRAASQELLGAVYSDFGNEIGKVCAGIAFEFS